jgi:hypothetical protein
MRKLLLMIAVVLGFTSTASASAQKDAIAKFYELRARMLDQRGTEADVDRLLELFKDTAKYEHPQFKVSMSKAEARHGMLSHLREGRDVVFKVHRLRESKAFAIAEITFSYTVNDKEIVRTGVAIFEFQGHRFTRVAEYGL